MNFKLIADFTAADIKAITDDFVSRVIRITQNELMQIGLEFVRDARSKQPDVDYHRDASDIVSSVKLAGGNLDLYGAGGFNDQTGNLRSSIGFILMYDGKIVYQDFEESPRGSDKATGIEEGKAYATEIGAEYSQGWAIITVAGMEYAAWVEAKGYDVITGSTLDAQAKLEGVMQRVLMAFE